MKIKTYDLNAYNLHMIKTEEFKNTKIIINFRKPIKKEDITYRNFLCDLLAESTNKYKTKQELSIKVEDLYGAIIKCSNEKIGNYTSTYFSMKVIDDKYSEEGNLEKAFKLLMEVLFNPNVNDNKFNEERFNRIKIDIEQEIKSVKIDKKRYSIIRALEESDKEGIYSLRKYGYEEDLNKITPQSLFKYYKKMLKSDLVDIFVIGNIDFSEMKNLITENVKLNTLKKKSKNVLIKNHETKKRVKKVIENADVMQARPSIICKTKPLTDFERKYVSKIYNHILGGTDVSLLYQSIREKNSLAYYAYSFFRSIDSILVIYMGVEYSNLNKAYSLTRKILDNMKKGKFSENLIEVGKKNYINAIKSSEDHIEKILDSYYDQIIIESDSYVDKIKNINKVTKEDVIKFAKKVYPDTLFVLTKEGKNGEN